MSDFIFIFLFSLILIVPIFLVYFYQKKEGFYSTYLAFYVLYFVYILFIPLELYITNNSYFEKGANFIEVSSKINIILFQSLFSLILTFFSLYLFLGFRVDSSINKNIFINKLFVISFTLCFCFLFRDELILSFLDYANVANISYGNQFFSIFKYLILLNFVVLGVRLYLIDSNKIYLLFLLIPFFFGAFSSDKNPMIMALIGFVFLFFENKKYSLFRIFSLILMLIPSLYFVLVSVLMFSYWRAGFPFIESYSLAYHNFSFTKIDPAGPFLSIATTLNQNSSLLLGASYLDNFSQLIPKFIYENRGSGLAEKFAQNNMAAWQEGQGYGYSPFSEAIENFGLLAFFHFGIIFTLWALIWNLCKKAFYWKYCSLGTFNIFYKIYGFYFLVLIFRIDSLILFKILPLYLLFGTILMFFSLKEVKQ
ncbi:hypothetical protein KTJ53_07945 [Acinetobacter variabilis]|uniref:hypothetical protein n=1 Tax=Acinetobacter variabilis TaxID=70346 RepID=UPI0021D05D1B|nr:hypothetical protein [Acinetobacter variabilis]MCU4629627.1 hypothetical protein [Acinetobacter variabilis]